MALKHISAFLPQSAREFAAAHDKYLNPPDDSEDDLLDEDGGYEQRRQRQIDLEDWQAETLRQKQECEE